MNFKVYQDYSRYVPITQAEYEKALFAFIKGRPAVFELGAVSRIESIVPDYNKLLGWYSDYKPNQDDNSDLERVKPKFKKFMALMKEKVEYLISTKQEHLIGKNVEIPELSQPRNTEIENATKYLADKMKI